MEIITRILGFLKGQLRTEALVIGFDMFDEPMIEGLYFSWCTRCGMPNHVGYFRVFSLGSLDVECDSCRRVKARRENYVIEVSPSEMGWSL